MRPSWVEVDLRAVAKNVARLAELVAPAELCAVVKADGYGHGDVPVASTALASGAARLAVALVEEGIRLREAGVEAPILLLSEPPPADAGEVVRWRLTPTVYTPRFVEALASTAGEGRFPVHVKVDTGMHRVGCDPSAFPELVESIRRSPNLTLEGVWTHFAVADSDPEFTRHQTSVFWDTTRWVGGVIRHLANTPAAVLHPRTRADMVRVGLGLYGLHPTSATREVVTLEPAMRIVSHVSHVRRHPAGTRPSYGRRRAMPREGWVATVPIGYADGYPRRFTDVGGEVLIRGRRYPLAGTVTMDQIVVDVGDDPVEIGDEVVLLGRQGQEEITADEWAARLGTINYEVVCLPGPRLPRRYQEV
ncbi:MAG: alanine racemase [Acidimicrobiia bacterium]|nr:MAG: alanine racemase [Acidimicrobiia bacterium]